MMFLYIGLSFQMRLRISIRGSVRPSVRPSVGPERLLSNACETHLTPSIRPCFFVLMFPCPLDLLLLFSFLVVSFSQKLITCNLPHFDLKHQRSSIYRISYNFVFKIMTPQLSVLTMEFFSAPQDYRNKYYTVNLLDDKFVTSNKTLQRLK